MHKWEDNFKMDLKEIEIWTGLIWLSVGPSDGLF
jgi:hypothetical protein